MEEVSRPSNYDQMRDQMAEVFTTYPQDEMISRYSLNHDDAWLYIRFFGRDYRIDRKNGTVTWSEDSFAAEKKAGYNEAMTIYDVLCNAKPGACLAHEWVNISSLAKIQTGNLQNEGTIFRGSVQSFDGRTKALVHACEQLDGEKRDRGDVAYEIPMFSFLPVHIRFWESDEDFPASMQILVDENILDFMHYETLMFALSHMLERMRTLCDEYTPE